MKIVLSNSSGQFRLESISGDYCEAGSTGDPISDKTTIYNLANEALSEVQLSFGV